MDKREKIIVTYNDVSLFNKRRGIIKQAFMATILLTGVNGYIGRRLLHELALQGHDVICGVGLRRGRRSQKFLEAGDTLDFWRVLVADLEEKRLLLYAEMKLHGKAWLEFKFVNEEGENKLIQTAKFMPKGLWGRLYWYAVCPFHAFIF